MKFKSDFIFVQGELLSGKTIVTDGLGTILSIEDQLVSDDIPCLPGIIVPGLFNCHAHLELAGTHFEKADGLTDFLMQMKNYYKEGMGSNNFEEIENLEKSLYEQGIEFCADIVNTDKTIQIKRKSNISYYNFIEYFESSFDCPKEKFNQLVSLKENFKRFFSDSYLCPHSLYTISNEFIHLYRTYIAEYKDIASIHFKESLKEESLNMLKNEVYNHQNTNTLPNICKNFEESHLLLLLNEIFDHKQGILFVHNIYMNEKESAFIRETYDNTAICVCPTSNLFIEKRLTDKSNIENFKKKVFLGTDSPASNPKMSFVNEMFLFQKNYNVKIQELIQICTEHPSQFFLQNEKGKIQPGKKPGLVLITSIDYNQMKLTRKSKTMRLI
jgi:aminodeoxyfutalosine deaminase